VVSKTRDYFVHRKKENPALVKNRVRPAGSDFSELRCKRRSFSAGRELAVHFYRRAAGTEWLTAADYRILKPAFPIQLSPLYYVEFSKWDVTIASGPLNATSVTYLHDFQRPAKPKEGPMLNNAAEPGSGAPAVPQSRVDTSFVSIVTAPFSAKALPH
jgi:hypothetical protein